MNLGMNRELSVDELESVSGGDYVVPKHMKRLTGYGIRLKRLERHMARMSFIFMRRR